MNSGRVKNECLVYFLYFLPEIYNLLTINCPLVLLQLLLRVLVGEFTEKLQLLLIDFLILLVLDFAKDLKLAGVGEVGIVEPIRDGPRNSVKGRCQLAFHDDEIVEDSFLEDS